MNEINEFNEFNESVSEWKENEANFQRIADI